MINDSISGHSLEQIINHSPLFCIARYGDNFIGWELNLDENCLSDWELKLATFLTAWLMSLKTNAFTKLHTEASMATSTI